MLIAGFKNPLTLEDIWNVRDEDTSVEASRALITEWNKELIKYALYRISSFLIAAIAERSYFDPLVFYDSKRGNGDHV